MCKRPDTHNVNVDRTRYPDGILRFFFAWPTGVIVTPPRHTKLILRPDLLCVQFPHPTKKLTRLCLTWNRQCWPWLS